MLRNHRLHPALRFAIALGIGTPLMLPAQTAGARPAPLISQRVDENKLVVLAGNTRPETLNANDLGAVSDDLPLDHMLLQLKRSPQQEQALARLIAGLHDPQSSNFHRWLTASGFGEEYGLAEPDVRTITLWLESHGFVINSIYPNRMVIDISGNAGQVKRAFHASIHNLNVEGVHHIANVSDPQIPEALAPAVAGIVSLNDFRPRSMIHSQYSLNSGTAQAVVPRGPGHDLRLRSFVRQRD